jgi:diguanylate cyclase (GGDEF)-like protein
MIEPKLNSEEIHHLRRELSQSYALTSALKKFNENIQTLDTDNFWLNLARIFAEVMKAERVSLLISDQESNSLMVKATIGLSEVTFTDEKNTFDHYIARQALCNGKPLLISNIENPETKLLLAERRYKSASFISYPIEIGNRKIGVLNFAGKTDGESYDELDLGLLSVLMPQWAVLIEYAELRRKARELELLSITDPLTGLLNRRYFDERIGEEISRSNRYDFPLSLMMIDVDDFKSYNDRFSHPEGDQALRLIAACLKVTVRASDIAARYGGEEFVVLLPQTNSVEAHTIAERFRQRVASEDFPCRAITVSIGVASFSPSVCTITDMIKAADQALYEAKRCGRNNVQVFESL